MSNGVILNYVTTHIDELISKTDTIIADLEGQEGKLLIDEAKGLIQIKFRGKYKDALENSLIDVEMSYMDSLANVKALRAVLIEYKAITSLGSKQELKLVADNVSINFDELYKQITNLEVKIGQDQILQNIMENDSDFDTWVTNYNTSLNDSLKTTYEVDEAGNLTEAGMTRHLADQYKEKIFRTNAKVFGELETKLATSFTNTAALVQSLEITAGILSRNLTDFSDIWSAFDFTKSDYQNFQVAHYDGLTQEEMNNLKIDIRNGDTESIIDDVIDIINNMLDEQSTSQDITEVVAALQGKLAEAMINDYKVGNFTANYKELLQLLSTLGYIFRFYPNYSIEAGTYNGNNVDVVGVAYANGVITLELKDTTKSRFSPTWEKSFSIKKINFGDTTTKTDGVKNNFSENYSGMWFSLLGMAATYIPGGHIGNFANLTASINSISDHNNALSIAIREELITCFGGHSAPGQESYPDATTILSIYIANDLGVIDLSNKNKNISNFLKLSEEEQEEKLVDLFSEESTEVIDWLRVKVVNPKTGEKDITRGTMLDNINDSVASWFENA